MISASPGMSFREPNLKVFSVFASLAFEHKYFLMWRDVPWRMLDNTLGLTQAYSKCDMGRIPRLCREFPKDAKLAVEGR